MLDCHRQQPIQIGIYLRRLWDEATEYRYVRCQLNILKEYYHAPELARCESIFVPQNVYFT